MYSTNTIKITQDGYGGEVILHLNNNGYVISQEFSGYDTTYIANFTYENGYVKNDGMGNEYSWLNGNIVQRTIKASPTDVYFQTYEYNNKVDLLNIDIFSWVLYDFAKGLKLKGFASNNYVVKLTGTEYVNGYPYPPQISTYDYQFDTEGYPTEITINGSDGKIIITYY
jgi:hypothetical protein